ncbi:hypothetical protein [Streptomyces mirabilis]|uniref:hypothetical protein n=1 Tax=Streptomyces mirabilis TaxID=68239 RepID=UPI00367B0FED
MSHTVHSGERLRRPAGGGGPAYAVGGDAESQDGCEMRGGRFWSGVSVQAEALAMA